MNLDRICEHYHGDLADPATERARERIHWICAQATGRDVLDIGCSQGIVCLILAREGFRCTGVDIEPASLAVGQAALEKEDELVRQRVSFRVADASQLPFEEASFDTVVLGEILEHLTHPGRVLAEARRVLRDGGRLVVTVPYGLSAFHDHKHTFYPLSLLELLRPLFKTGTLATQGNYILYTGQKDPTYDPAQVPVEARLAECRHWAQALETRCLEKERALLETSTKLYAQIKTLTAQTTAQAATLQELQQTLAARDHRVQDLEHALADGREATAAVREELARATTELQNQTRQVQELRHALAARDAQLRSLQAALDETREAATALREKLARTEAEAAAGALRIEDLRAAVAARDRQLQALEQRLAEAHTVVSQLRDQCARAETEQARLREQLAGAATALAATQQQITDLQNERTALRQELTAKEAAWQTRLAETEARAASNLQAKDRQWREAEAQFAARLRDKDKQLQALSAQRDADWSRRAALQRLRDLVRTVLPPDARVLVVSKGDDELLQLDGRPTAHFPQTTGGVYAGYHPADSAEAIAHLEALKAKGAGFLLIPATSFWWLDFYAEFRRHLESSGRLLVYSEDTCAIFALHADPKGSSGSLPLTFRAAPEQKPPSTPAPKRADPPTPVAAPAPPRPLPAAPKPTPAPAPAPPPTPTAGVSMAKPEFKPRPRPPGARLVIGGILDEFTAACFRPECDLVTFRPDNWRSVLEATRVDLLFVESAWHGNGGSWQYKIASFKKPMGEEVVDVVRYCKERGIPTVFWNKEDPSHFDRFIHRAGLFDFVFTTDADMVPQYRAVVKHDRVFALPFAAQPRIHHPILEKERAHNVCFAGAYYAFDHDERRADIEHLLRPALAFGLHIYDRQHGVVGANAKAYQFPDIYQPAIQGRLEYDDMVKAYKWYRVFLNVNSVKRSPTMFSRRVFELLASGTPVVSAYARGIEEMFGRGLVLMAGSEQETRAHLEKLLGDDRYWAEISVRGIRAVLSRHTYAHRLAELCARVGLRSAGVPLPRIEAFARVASGPEAAQVVKSVARQAYRPFRLTLLVRKTVPKSKLDTLLAALPNVEVRFLTDTAGDLARLADTATGDLLWLVNPADFYGAHFLQDAALATLYSDAEVFGKQTHFAVRGDRARPELKRPGGEFRFVSDVAPGSLLARRGRLAPEQWTALAAGRPVDLSKQRVLSLDRFNYVRGGNRLGDTDSEPALAQVTV